MTIFELAIALSVVTAAICGAVAGSSTGALAAAAGLLAGGVIGFVASVLPVLLFGGLLLPFSPGREAPRADDTSSSPHPSADAPPLTGMGPLVAAMLLLVMVPILTGPVWTAYLAYRAVEWLFGGG